MFMGIVDILSLRGTCGRGKQGAILVRDSRIIATGYNGPPSGHPHCSEEHCDLSLPCQRSVHAEANAIVFAAKYGIATNDSTMYCTTLPCRKCAELIIQAGIKAVFYKKDYHSHEGLELLLYSGITCQQYEGQLQIDRKS